MSETTPIKEEARRLVDELPENATWSDFARLVIERQRIEEGIADLDAGISWTTDEIREKLGIPKSRLSGLTGHYDRLPTSTVTFLLNQRRPQTVRSMSS